MGFNTSQEAEMHDNIAARAGRWSAAHWKTATLGWLVLVVAAVALGQFAGTRQLTDAESSNGDTARAQQILDRAHWDESAAEAVLVQAKGRARPDAVAAQVSSMLRARQDVKTVKAPVRAHDGRSLLVAFELRGNGDTADTRVQPVLNAVARIQHEHPAFTVAEFGAASANHALNESVGKDFSRAEKLSLPITFLILLFAFGAFVAAGLPVLLAFSAVLASLGLSSLVSHVAHASSATSSVILLIGMAVGVDYSLFYVKREREERAAGREGREALHRAAATSGQAVLVSGATVMIAMAGMLFAGSAVFTSIGIGAMIVVFISMIGSLTVLPALLAKLGDRIDRGVLAVGASGIGLAFRRREPRWIARLRTRRTLLQKLKGERNESRVWAALLRPSLRHPVVAVVLASSLLIVLALPAAGLRTKMPGFTDLPRGMNIVQTYRTMQAAFPGASSPASVVVDAPDVHAPRVQSAIAELERAALATGLVKTPVRTTANRAGTVETVDLPLVGDGQSATAVHALHAIRTQVVPATVGKLPGVQAPVTGETAGDVDFTSAMHAHMPLVFAFVLGLAFLLLLVTFRSIVIPLKAIALNLLSVGAAYGVLVWIFQDGHLQGLLGFHSNGGIVTWLPLFLFTILFGLSMDYHVFIVSRIKELVDRGLSTEEAVERGIRSTASTVTSAAFVMVAVFSIFATLSTVDMKQLGVGLAVAVLLDATIIRGVLLPATMKLLGRWNWYLPRGLHWLPQLQAESA
ncbi:MAG: MMPL family transporter [Gaiellaceae bacterium]